MDRALCGIEIRIRVISGTEECVPLIEVVLDNCQGCEEEHSDKCKKTTCSPGRNPSHLIPSTAARF